MKNHRRFIVISLLSFLSLNLFSQGFPVPDGNSFPLSPDHPERPKKRFPLERKPEEPFIPVFLKSLQEENYLFLEIVLNSAVRKESIFESQILINNHPVEKEFVLFSRDAHRCKFRIYNISDKSDEILDIKLAGILSWDGLMIPPIEIVNIEKNAMYKFDKESGQWLKFSL